MNYFRPLGPRALLRWQARVVARALLAAPAFWVGWQMFWSVLWWSGRWVPR